MCQGCKENIIEEVRPIVLAGSLGFQNGILLSGSNVELGSPLLRNTDITGNYIFNLGTNTSRLQQLNIRSSNQILLDFNNNNFSATLSLTSSGVILTDLTSANPKGFIGAADYSANYNSLTYIQKTYADTRIASKQLSATLLSPGAGQDGYSIKWDNGTGKFTLSANTLTAGTNKQVIFNDSGVLAGDANFTYDKTTGELKSGYLLTLNDFNTTGNVTVSAAGSGNVNLQLSPLGDGNINLNVLNSGIINLGSTLNTATIKMLARGSSGTININIAPKGSAGLVYIGDYSAGGSTRTIQAIGSASDVDLILSPKGAGVLNANGAKFTNLATATNPSDAVRYDQLTALSATVSSLSTSVSGKANKVQGSWTAIPLIAGWITHAGSYSVPKYRVNQFGRMEIKGIIESAGGGPAGYGIFSSSGGWMNNTANEINKVPVIIDRGGVSIASYLEIQPDGAAVIVEATLAGDIVTCNCDFPLD